MAESNEIVFIIRLKEVFTEVVKKVNGGLAGIEAAGKRVSSGFLAIQKTTQTVNNGLSGLTSTLLKLAGAYASLAAANKAIDIAKGQAEAEQRLSTALRNNAELLDRRKAAIADLASRTTFSQSSVTDAEALLRTFGVSDNQIDIALKAVVNRAAAFNTSLEEQARQIGITFATGLTGELGEREAGVRNLGVAALKSGDQFKILADKYAGFAQGLASGDFGRAAQQANQFSEAIGKIGAALVNLKTRALDVLLPPLKKVADFFEAINSIGLERVVDGFVAQFKTIKNVVIGFISDVFDFISIKLDAFSNRIAAVILDAIPDDKQGTFSAAAQSSRDVAAALDRQAASINFTGNARERIDAGNAEAEAAAKTAAQAEARLQAEHRVNEAMIDREKIQKEIEDLNAKALQTADKTTQQIEQQRKILASSREELASIEKKLPGLLAEEKGSDINPALTSEVNKLLARQAQLVATIKQGEQAIADLQKQRAKDLLDHLERSRSLYNQTVQANAALVKVGALSASEAQRRNADALDTVRAELVRTADSIQGLLAEKIFSPQDAQDLLARIKLVEIQLRDLPSEAVRIAGDLRDGLQSPFESFFQSILSGTANIKKAFQSLASDIIGAFEKILANRFAESFLNLLGGGGFQTNAALGGAPASGGLFGGLGGIFSAILNPFAGIFKLFGFAEGGLVPGSGTGDTVPAALKPQEYVLIPQMVRMLGLENLEHLRRAALGGSIIRPPSISGPIRMASGGLVPSSSGVKYVGIPAVVTDDQGLARMLKGGNSAFHDHLRRNQISIRNALGL